MREETKTNANGLTWDDLVALEPRLGDLLREAKAHRRRVPPRFCANAVWYGYPGHEPGLKRRLLALVGFEALTDVFALRTPAAYDLAYDTIYEAPPDCRPGCACSPG